MKSFVLDDNEFQDYRRFQRHRCKARHQGLPNPCITVAFTETSIGTAVKVECHCGASKNITDYETW